MKRMSWFFGAVVVGVMALTGCSSPTETTPAAPKTATSKGLLTVQGSVSSKLGTDNARAIAVGDNGKKVWTYLDAHGDFSLKLPTGQSYRVLIANQLPDGTQKVIGKLTAKDGTAVSDVISAKKTGTLDIGVLRKPDVTTTNTIASTKSLHISCGCSDDEGADTGGGGEGGWGGGGGDDWGNDGDTASDMGGNWGGGEGGWGNVGGYDGAGGWDDGGNWGGAGGWEDSYGQGGWDDSAGGWDDGSSDGSGIDHSDDGGCFSEGEWGADGADGQDGQGGGWEGAGGVQADGADVNPCDICTAGDPIALVPSKGGFSDYLGIGGKLAKLEANACSPSAMTADSADGADATQEGLAAAKTTSTKKIGDTCSTKAGLAIDEACVAGKVVKK